MHKRRQLLEAIKAQLKELPNFGGVKIQRIAPIRARYPLIIIYDADESVQIASIHQHPRDQDRELNFNVTVWIKGTADDEKAEMDMDNAAEQIETKLTNPAGVQDMYLTGTDKAIDEEEAEIHAVTLSYTIKYETQENSPTV